MILFGERQVLRALKAGFEFDELFFCESIATTETISKEFDQPGLKCVILASEVFTKLMFGERGDKVIGIAKRPEFELNHVKFERPGLVLVAQAIEKPGNLGAILRSAEACGVSAVLVVDALTDLYHPNTIRASTGAVFSLQTVVTSSKEAREWLKGHQFRIFAAQLDGATDFFQQQLTGDVAIVVGNEAAGLDEHWKNENCVPVRLPMLGKIDSLNVSVTASVMLYESTRQRRL